MDDPLVCKLCGELYTDPLVLSCGHSLCAKCVDALAAFVRLSSSSSSSAAKVEISCPTCACASEVDGALLRRNRDLADAVDAHRRRIQQSQQQQQQQIQQQQSSSDKAQQQQQLCQMDCGRPAALHCPRCSNALFCADCFRVQHATGVFRTHEPRALECGSNGALLQLLPTTLTCSEHPSQELALFCIACRRPVCVICAQFSRAHRGHECIALGEHAEECRAQIASGLAELARRRQAVGAALEASQSRRQVSGQALQDARAEVAAAFGKLENALRQRREELLRMLDSADASSDAGGDLQHALRDMLDFISGLQARYEPLQHTQQHDVAVAISAHELSKQLRKCAVDTDALQARVGHGFVPTTRVRINTESVVREIRALGFVERTLSIGGDSVAQFAEAQAAVAAAAAAAASASASPASATIAASSSDSLPSLAIAPSLAVQPSSATSFVASSSPPSFMSMHRPALLSPPSAGALRFHAVHHGPYAVLSDGGRRATRTNAQDNYNNAVLTLSGPLKPGTPAGRPIFEVVVGEVSRKWAGSLSLRFFTELVQPLPACIQTNLMETFSVDLGVGDHVGLGLDPEGRSLLYVRGKCLGHVPSFGTLPTDRPLFACVDLYGKVTSVDLVQP